ncbi:uncharacterized protein DUF4244 [Stackebrandtia endophytica]|uniref:Uncharacterized protein DUF4244 n=1 Tax=Stackebrandtia endophytica TaxID=1496996 RepID=A0A543AYB3_9ACTN|nr:uncharacterized protein DUF4244 [Stackebrandtia endophytica]
MFQQRYRPVRRPADQTDSVWQRCRRRLRGDDGMISAEYAVGTIAAVAFAGVLLKVLSSEGIVSALQNLISEALS